MTKSYDAIIIGGGHNGLVCAAYLADSGRKVLVLEANKKIGGAAITREFADGFNVSAGAHILHLLQPKVLSDLGISLHSKVTPINTIALSEDAHVTYDANNVWGQSISDADTNAYPQFKKRMRTYAETLSPLMMKTPPRLASGVLADSKTLIKLGWDIRFGLGKDKMQDFLRIVGINIFDLLEEDFENETLKGALGFDAVLGTHMGPRTPNSVLSYLYRLTGESHSGLALPKGGMGEITKALSEAALRKGVEIRCNSPVANVALNDGRATGVVLESGEEVKASLIVSNADPKRTFLKMVGAQNLEAFFAHRINNIRMRGSAAKLHLALDDLPNFKGVESNAMGNRFVIAPTIKDVERAFNPSKYGEYSPNPAMEIVIPSVADPSLTAGTGHVLSATVQYAPYHLKGGWDETTKHAFTEIILDRIANYAPNIREIIRHKELLSPVDLEQEFNMTGGHWHHGEFAIDQLLMMRPVHGSAQYRTPIDGLYLCGAGAHPGGGIMGAAGHNAAKAIISGEKTS